MASPKEILDLVSRFEHQLDRLVFELYELTAEKIAIVEQGSR